MTNICENTDAFFDGEMSPDDAIAFRDHLASCQHCQASLHDLTQLNFLEAQARQQIPKARISKAPRRVVPGAARFFVMAAAAIALIVLLKKGRPPAMDHELLTQGATSRPFEARLAHPGLRTHKPYNPHAGSVAATSTAGNSIPLKKLAGLEDISDWHGLGAAYLWNGEYERAALHLDRAHASPAVENDRAVLMLARGDDSAALQRLDSILAKSPSLHAHWNRAVVLHRLGLDMQAAAEFATVADAGELGWAGEARVHSERLHAQVLAEQTGWQSMSAAGRELVQRGKPVTAHLLDRYPDELRLYFYDAVRAAPSVEQILALKPVATLLDRYFGGEHLQSYLSHVASTPFQVRGPLANIYYHLATSSTHFSTQEIDQFLIDLRINKQDDILLGALLLSDRVEDNLTEYLHLASKSGDPWFSMLGEQLRATVEIAHGRPLEAEPNLVRAVSQCRVGLLHYRCAYLYFKLGDLYKKLNRTVEAKAQAHVALGIARRIRAWDLETSILALLGDIAFFENDYSLTSAYLREVLLRAKLGGDDCRWARFLHEHLAMVDLFSYRFDSARQVLSGQCGNAPSILGLFVAVDLARVGKPAESLADTQQKIDRLLTKGPREEMPSAWRDFLTGRLLSSQDSARSQQLLRNAITVAEQQPASNADADKLRAYSYQTLVADAGGARAYANVLELLAAELKVKLPMRCTIGLGLDGDLLTVVVRGSKGQLQGKQEQIAYDSRQKVETLIPAEFYVGLQPCNQVEVLAEAAMQGLAAILPPEIAWSYRLSPDKKSTGIQPAHSLVVSEADVPAGLQLLPLAPWQHQPEKLGEATILRGAAATPGETLRAMTRASEIIIHAHGLVNLGLADASLLVLSPDADGQYALTAGQVQRTTLMGAPVVVLSACHAAKPSPFLYTPWSLPAAFITAGATAVFAATTAIPSAEASTFFVALLQRLRRGEAPGPALRDERMIWLSKDAKSWVRNVLLFN